MLLVQFVRGGGVVADAMPMLSDAIVADVRIAEKIFLQTLCAIPIIIFLSSLKAYK